MKTIVMTGVTSGIGREWLYQLDQTLNANFLLLVRNIENFNQYTQSNPLKNSHTIIPCDLSSISSVKNAALNISRQTDHIDILINNAGIWSNDQFTETVDNIEITLAVNVLSPFLLTGSLLHLLSNSSQAKIINTASFRYKDAKINLEDLELKESYTAEQAYCNSKLYSILFTKQLAHRLKDSNISVNCFDPGFVDTPMLKRAFPEKWRKRYYPFFKRFIAKSSIKGAKTGVNLSIDSKYQTLTGHYFKNNRQKKLNDLANNSALQHWIWSQCETYTQMKYPKTNLTNTH